MMQFISARPSRRLTAARPLLLAAASLFASAAALVVAPGGIGQVLADPATPAFGDSTGLAIDRPSFADRGVTTTRVEEDDDQTEAVRRRVTNLEDELVLIEEELTEAQEIVDSVSDLSARGDIEKLDTSEAGRIDAKVVGILGYELPNRLPEDDEFIIFRNGKWEYEVVLWPPREALGEEEGPGGSTWGGDWLGQLGHNDLDRYAFYNGWGSFNIQTNGEIVYHHQAYSGSGSSQRQNIQNVSGSQEDVDATLNLFQPPADIDFAGKFIQLAAGTRHSCGIDEDRKAWCWGYGFNGRLGQGSENTNAIAQNQRGGWVAAVQHLSHSSYPIPVDTDLRFKKIAPGHRHTCAIDTSDEIWCWGSNVHFSFGLGARFSDGIYGIDHNIQKTEVARPEYQITLENGPWLDVGSGEWFSCGLKVDGSMYCWGRTGDGAVPDPWNPNGTQVQQNYTSNNFWTGESVTGNKVTSFVAYYPVRVGGTARYTSMSVGMRHVCAIDIMDQAWCWGWNQYGATGGSGTVVKAPVAVGAPGQYKKIAAGALHTCAIDQDDKAWCWGYGGSGRLGNESTSNSTSPVAVSGDHRFKDISTRGPGTCALDFEGKAWCWGDNSTGVVNAKNPREGDWQAFYTTPQLVEGTSGLLSISIGPGFALATKP